jgi:hypothetical protein
MLHRELDENEPKISLRAERSIRCQRKSDAPPCHPERSEGSALVLFRLYGADPWSRHFSDEMSLPALAERSERGAVFGLESRQDRDRSNGMGALSTTGRL